MEPNARASRAPFFILLAFALAFILGMRFVPRIPQDPAYHQFADARPLFGIPNFMDVVSNTFFIFLGAWGFRLALSRMEGAGVRQRQIHFPYALFFAGLFLTGFGSGWYHLWPDNHSILWDRLPLATAFLSLFAGVIHERFDVGGGPLLAISLSLLAVGSVVFWYTSELRGAGDLRPYLVVQFFPMLAIPILIVFFPSRMTRVPDLAWVLGLYALAKAAEVLDKRIWNLGHLMSGHTVKHLLSAAAVFVLARMVKRRREA